MENIIKKVIEIESAAKDQLIEIKQLQQKYKDDCSHEFKELKQLKYRNIDEKINLYKRDRKRVFDMNVDTIESNQEKINQKLINDFKSRYDNNLNELFAGITK